MSDCFYVTLLPRKRPCEREVMEEYVSERGTRYSTCAKHQSFLETELDKWKHTSRFVKVSTAPPWFAEVQP